MNSWSCKVCLQNVNHLFYAYGYWFCKNCKPELELGNFNINLTFQSADNPYNPCLTKARVDNIHNRIRAEDGKTLIDRRTGRPTIIG